MTQEDNGLSPRSFYFLLEPTAALLFPAKVIQSQGGAAYLVREQRLTAGGAFSDKTGVDDLSARNLAELSLGPGAAVAVGAIVLVTAMQDGSTPPAVCYIFDHPVYTKYLD